MPDEKARRYMRRFQARARGGRSYKTEAEDLRVLLAVAEGELTQSAAAKALGTDIVSLRGRIHVEAAAGVAMAFCLLPPRIPPVAPPAAG